MFVVTFIANEEFTESVRVESKTGSEPSHDELKPMIDKFIKDHNGGMEYSFRIESIVKFSRFINSNVPYIGLVGKRISDTTDAVKLAEKVGNSIHDELFSEVERLVKSGGIDREDHNPNSVIAVALENIASRYKNEKCDDYKNLRNF